MPTVTIEKPKAIILDFMSTCVKTGFIEKCLYRFIKVNGREIIQQKWDDKHFKEIVAQVRRQTRKDLEALGTTENSETLPQVLDKKSPVDAQQDSLYANLVWMIDHKRETDAHYRLKFAIYEDAYQKKALHTHVYQDVARNIRKWKDQGIKIVLFSHAWIQTQRLFMNSTNHGELTSCIEGYYDTQTQGSLTNPQSYHDLCIKHLGVNPNEVIFLTKGTHEGHAARLAGIHSFIVISHNYQLEKYKKEELESFERLGSFDELVWKE